MYRYLTVSKAARERVAFPDGTQSIVKPAEGAAAAARWQSANGEAVGGALQSDQAKLAAELADWKRELSRRQDASPVSSISFLRQVREELEAEWPRPEGPDEGDEGDASLSPQPTVERLPWWVAAGPEEGRSTPLGPGSDPFPRAELAERLSELERDGWLVAHVSEDRVVEYDESAARATIIGASVLLRRASS